MDSSGLRHWRLTMLSNRGCTAMDDAQRRLLLEIAALCDHAGNLTDEAAEDVLRMTVGDVNTYNYLCVNGLVNAKNLNIGFGTPTGLSAAGLECVASLRENV